MKEIILIIFLIIDFTNHLFAQNIQSKISLVSYEKDSMSHLGYIIAWNYNGRSKFRNIPEEYDSTNSFIKRIKLPVVEGGSVRSLDSLFVLLGKKDSTHTILIFDRNKNFDFSDDTLVEINKNSVHPFCIYNIPYKIFYEQKASILVVNLRFSFNPGGLRLKNEQEQNYFLAVDFASYQNGIINDNIKGKIRLDVFMQTPAVCYDNDNTIIKLWNSSKNEPGYSKEYKIGDLFYIGYVKYKFENIDLFGRSITISKLGFRAKREVGVDTGFYAPNISTIGISGNKVSLNELKGRYVLIDFWGTWCAPCIALLPHLRLINKKYSQLKMVSIAAEVGRTVSKDSLRRAVIKYEMKWENIYQSFSSAKSLMKEYKIISYPTTILIDPNGKIIFRGGSIDMDKLDVFLESIFE